LAPYLNIPEKETAVVDIQLQKQYQRGLLKLNQLLIKYDIGEQLTYSEIKKLLYYDILFTSLMRNELMKEDEDTRLLVYGLDLYRFDKDSFINQFKYTVVVFWERSGIVRKVEMFPSLESYLDFRKERVKEGFREVKVEILPTLDHLIFIGRKIVEVGSKLGVLNILISRKPEFDPLGKDDEVVNHG